MIDMPALPGPYAVRAPKLYYFSPDTNTQVQECLPDATDLKSYALQHFTTRDPSRKLLCHDLGYSLGTWLRQFHGWVSLAEQQAMLYDIAKSNKPMQAIKHMVNYSTLVATVDTFLSILGDAKDVFEQVGKMAAAELERDDLEIIHGDFWTGKYVADAPLLGLMMLMLYPAPFSPISHWKRGLPERYLLSTGKCANSESGR
jgi:hypothetical protein